MELQEVRSKNIHSMGYDPANQTLAILFRSKIGGPANLYHYSNVPPEVWAEFQEASSKGFFFDRFIKPFKDLYPYQRQP